MSMQRNRRRGIAALLLAWMSGPPLVANAAPPLTHHMEVSLDPVARTLAASDRIEVSAHTPLELVIAASLEVLEFRVDGLAADVLGTVEGGLRRFSVAAAAAPREVELRWRGELAPLEAGQSHRQTLGPARAVADPHGSFLPAASLWYARSTNVLAAHRVTLELPPGQRGLVPGTLVDEEEAR